MGIRFRLTLWYAGATAVMLLLIGVVATTQLSSGLLARVDRELVQAADVARDDLLGRQDPEAAIRRGHVPLPAAALTAPVIYLQVVRGDESVAARSDNLGRQRLPLDMDIVAINMLGQAAFKTIVGDEGGRLRLYSAPVVVSGKVIGAVQAGYPLGDLDAALDEARTALVVGGLVAVVAAGGIGWVLSRMALRPFDRVTQATAQILGAGGPVPRLPLPGADDEVGRLVKAFNALLDRLAEVIEAQQRLGADVSHELRTPLTTIKGNVDLLRRGGVDDPRERNTALDTIEVETSRMSRLVADLLLLAQADAGTKLEKQPVELDTLLLQVYRQAQTMAAASFPGAERVTVRLGDEDQAVVMGDPDRLRQLLLNLVDNALKYTPRGGIVTLSLVRAEGWVRIVVQDTGVGIPPNALPHIFERYYRVPRLGRKGAGLGLSIARWIAEAHDGRLEVHSEVGSGSTFTVWLPEAQVSPV